MRKTTQAKPPLPVLTRAESELMRLLWEHGPSQVSALVERLDSRVAYNTVLTTVRILEQKGYVTHEAAASGRAFVYRSAVPAEHVRKRHVKDLVERLFGGHAQALVTGLLEEETLTRAELAALRAEIDAKLKGKRGA